MFLVSCGLRRPGPSAVVPVAHSLPVSRPARELVVLPDALDASRTVREARAFLRCLEGFGPLPFPNALERVCSACPT